MHTKHARQVRWSMIGTSAVALITVLLVQSASAQDADKDKFEETFRARAMAMGNVAFGASTTVHITINRWTTDEERRHLIETLVEKEPEDLLKALQKQKETGAKTERDRATDRPIGFWEAVQRRHLIETLVEKEPEDLLKALQKQKETGYMRVTGSGAGRTRWPSVRLHYAREFRGEGKRVIRLATDRPIGFWEAVQNPSSMTIPSRLSNFALMKRPKKATEHSEWVSRSSGIKRKTVSCSCTPRRNPFA